VHRARLGDVHGAVLAHGDAPRLSDRRGHDLRRRRLARLGGQRQHEDPPVARVGNQQPPARDGYAPRAPQGRGARVLPGDLVHHQQQLAQVGIERDDPRRARIGHEHPPVRRDGHRLRALQPIGDGPQDLPGGVEGDQLALARVGDEDPPAPVHRQPGRVDQPVGAELGHLAGVAGHHDHRVPLALAGDQDVARLVQRHAFRLGERQRLGAGAAGGQDQGRAR